MRKKILSLLLVVFMLFTGTLQVFTSELVWAASLESETMVEDSQAGKGLELETDEPKQVGTNALTVSVDKKSYKGSFEIYAINEVTGKEYKLSRPWYSFSNEYSEKVPYCTYQFEMRGLNGYHAEFNPNIVVVNASSSPKVNAVLVEGEQKPESGTLSIEFLDQNNKNVVDVDYEIKNSENEVVTKLSGLAFGQYTVEIKNYNKEKYEIAETDRKQTVVLSESNPKVKINFIFTKKVVFDGTAKVQVNFWRLIPNKNDIRGLIFGKRYSVYAVHPVSGKKIYGSYKASTDLPIPDFLLGKYKTLVKTLGIKISLNDIYELELPTTEDGTAYRIQASCSNRGLATADSYCDIVLKSGTEPKIGFQVADNAEPIKIISSFSDGKNRNIEYVAIKKGDPIFSTAINFILSSFVFSGKNGAEIRNMSKLTDGVRYKIVPSYIPEGFDANPTEHTVIGKERGKTLEPIKFEYTRNGKAALHVRFKTGFFRKPQGENPYEISIFDADNNKLSIDSRKIGKNTYEFVVPADKEAKTYKIEALCKDTNYILKHTYKKISVKEDETKKLDFDVQKAEPLNIESRFSDGEEREVKYIASFGDTELGASYIGVSPLKLYPGQTYTVKPVNVPEEFTIDVEEQETSSNFLGTVFKPMRFKYTKKTSTKILVEIKGKTNYKAEAEVFALGTDGERYKGLRNTDGNYEIYVPATVSGTKFKVEAQSLENKFTLKDTYKTVEVKDKEEARLEFELVRSSTLEIKTVFPVGTEPKPEVSYVAEREDNTDERGAVYTDMTRLYKESKYKVRPSSVPKGYLVKPETQTTEKVKKGWWLFKKDGFKPMSFTFEKKPMAKLTLKAKLKNNEEALEGVSFEIENEEGKKLTEEDWKERVELGKYRVTVLFDETKYELAEGDKTREVVLDKDGEEKTVNFLFEKTVKGSLILKAVDEKNNDITKDISFTVKQGDQIINQFTEIKLGEYVVEAVYNEENYKLQEEQKNPVTVNLTKENKDVEYTFKFNKVNPLPPIQDKGKLTVRVSRYGKIADFDKISIYIVDKDHKKISTPEWETKIESSWIFGDAMVYSAELPVAADGTEYIVQADCNIDGKGFWNNNYEKIKLDKKGKTVSFSLNEAKSLNIISNFTDGAKCTVKYKAEGGTADKGFYITDMNRLCAVNKYKISPVEVPSGYTVTPEFQEAKYDYGLKKFTDLEFKYSPKNATP